MLRLLDGTELEVLPANEIQRLQDQLEKLKIRMKSLQEQISKVKQEKIKLLHQYNEIKDFCQYLLGKLALMQETTVASLYPRFGLDFDN